MHVVNSFSALLLVVGNRTQRQLLTTKIQAARQADTHTQGRRRRRKQTNKHRTTGRPVDIYTCNAYIFSVPLWTTAALKTTYVCLSQVGDLPAELRKEEELKETLSSGFD
jgi:hypothetical protein